MEQVNKWDNCWSFAGVDFAAEGVASREWQRSEKREARLRPLQGSRLSLTVRILLEYLSSSFCSHHRPGSSSILKNRDPFHERNDFCAISGCLSLKENRSRWAFILITKVSGKQRMPAVSEQFLALTSAKIRIKRIKWNKKEVNHRALWTKPLSLKSYNNWV